MKFLIINLLAVFAFTSSVYSIQFFTVSGVSKTFSAWQDKKILVVNTASASPRASQLAGIRQLRQQYGDSLVIVLFPSNSFGNEPLADSSLRAYYDSAQLNNCVIAQKQDVKGGNTQAIYRWLTNISDNGDMNFPIGGDYQKYLIGKTGRIEAVFAPSVSPTDPQVTNAIAQ